jgi:hypothetical protein
MQLEGPKRKKLNHSIIGYIKSIIMTNDEYLEALEEKTIKKNKIKECEQKRQELQEKKERRALKKGIKKSNKA